ncbi:MAG: hypothetical protein DMG09_17305 [Acidobacteria bacterium]|nr:MAG: hypothetical protein DMG09_17305 [Acidobacteriota bacterium]
MDRFPLLLQLCGTIQAMIQGSLFEPPARQTTVRVGPAGWHYKDWEGTVYPSGKGRSFDALAFIADYFDTVEINSSFYRPPRPEDAASWARRVRKNRRFKFTAKAWQRLTHEREGSTEESLAKDCEAVRRSMAPIAEAGILAALLLQFPWSFRCSPENQEYLEKLFRLLREFPLAVEVRHGGWDREPFYQFLKENRVAFCNVDQPVIGNSIRPGSQVTSRVGYFRLHGRNYKSWFNEEAGRDARYDYLYPKPEVQQIVGLLRTIQQNAEETYAITNNHFRGQSLTTALDILEELDARPPDVPPLLAATYPHLAH